MPLVQYQGRKNPTVYPPHVGGLFYCSPIPTVFTTFIVTANILYASPFYVPALTTYISIVLEVTGLISSTTARMAIYNDSAGMPDTIVASTDIGTVSTASTGAKTNVIAVALNPGWYWLASCYSGAPTVRALSQTNALPVLGFTSTTDVTLHVGVSVAFTYAALPSPFTGGAVLATTALPRILVGV